VAGYLAERDVTASDLGLDAIPLVVDGSEVAELVLLTDSESSSA
jgi:hypothetical protein